MNITEAKAKIKTAGLDPADFDCRAIAAAITAGQREAAAEIAEYLEEGLPVPAERTADAEYVTTDGYFWDVVASYGLARSDEAHGAAVSLAA